MCLLQYYKHVVQSIEKFAQKVSLNSYFLDTFGLHFVVKLFWWGNLHNLFSLIVANIRLFMQCRQEYKIPALYVMDSVIRQSRHQVKCCKISV